MERRTFLERFIFTSILGTLFLAAGCGKKEKTAGDGNQEKLWILTTGNVKSEEPLEPAYAKETPAKFRDASMGKVDASFVPKVQGG